MEAQLTELDARLEATNERVISAKSTLTTYMLLLNRLNLPYGIDEIIRKLVRLKMTVDTLIRAITLLEVAATPWGWLKGIGLLAVAGVSGYSLLTYESYTGR